MLAVEKKDPQKKQPNPKNMWKKQTKKCHKNYYNGGCVFSLAKIKPEKIVVPKKCLKHQGIPFLFQKNASNIPLV